VLFKYLNAARRLSVSKVVGVHPGLLVLYENVIKGMIFLRHSQIWWIFLPVPILVIF